MVQLNILYIFIHHVCSVTIHSPLHRYPHCTYDTQIELPYIDRLIPKLVGSNPIQSFLAPGSGSEVPITGQLQISPRLMHCFIFDKFHSTSREIRLPRRTVTSKKCRIQIGWKMDRDTDNEPLFHCVSLWRIAAMMIPLQ